MTKESVSAIIHITMAQKEVHETSFLRWIAIEFLGVTKGERVK